MEHPRYAKGDPKEGQRVLIGDTVYVRNQVGEWFAGMVARISDDQCALIRGSVNWFYPTGYPIFSAPRSSPAIEPCVCGHLPPSWTADYERTQPYRVPCDHCGRHGPIADTAADAVSLWNADARKLKAICDNIPPRMPTQLEDWAERQKTCKHYPELVSHPSPLQDTLKAMIAKVNEVTSRGETCILTCGGQEVGRIEPTPLQKLAAHHAPSQ